MADLENLTGTYINTAEEFQSTLPRGERREAGSSVSVTGRKLCLFRMESGNSGNWRNQW